jgi:hypothetical protein
MEHRRGCGWRGLYNNYLAGDSGGFHCCKLPFPLEVCPTCNTNKISKQNRSVQWVNPQPLLVGDCSSTALYRSCPLAFPERLGDRVALMWVGEKFYRRPEDFMREGQTLGYSKRISRIPRGFEIGKTHVFLAHPKTIKVGEKWLPGIFTVWVPQRIEQLILERDLKSEEKMQELSDKGITPVVVPDDPKHRRSVYSRNQDQ